MLLSAAIVLLLFGFFKNLYPFLAPEKMPNEGLMVVEGWIHEFALDEAVAIYRDGNYSKIICTGTPIETGSYIQQFKSFPEMTEARLLKLGINPDEIIVTISEETKKDRTYSSAIALREAFMSYNIGETKLHLITSGPHGRRSRMLFKKALGQNYQIGITCLVPSNYDVKTWYTCSEGVRCVIGELIAYSYALFFFHP